MGQREMRDLLAEAKWWGFTSYKRLVRQRRPEEPRGQPPGRIPAAPGAWERKRRQRQVWGLGPVRRVLNERYRQPDWYEDWRKHTGSGARHGVADREA